MEGCVVQALLEVGGPALFAHRPAPEVQRPSPQRGAGPAVATPHHRRPPLVAFPGVAETQRLAGRAPRGLVEQLLLPVARLEPISEDHTSELPSPMRISY